eukprot:6198983-Pleurochrysis_carterae.AAC.13
MASGGLNVSFSIEGSPGNTSHFACGSEGSCAYVGLPRSRPSAINLSESFWYSAMRCHLLVGMTKLRHASRLVSLKSKFEKLCVARKEQTIAMQRTTAAEAAQDEVQQQQNVSKPNIGRKDLRVQGRNGRTRLEMAGRTREL